MGGQPYVAFVESEGVFIGPEADQGEGAEAEDELGSDLSPDKPLFRRFLPNDRDEEFDDAVIEARDRRHLLDILRELSIEFKSVSGSPYVGQELHIVGRCGRPHYFMAWDDLPLLSKLCECGHEWIIYYREPWVR